MSEYEERYTVAGLIRGYYWVVRSSQVNLGGMKSDITAEEFIIVRSLGLLLCLLMLLKKK